MLFQPPHVSLSFAVEWSLGRRLRQSLSEAARGVKVSQHWSCEVVERRLHVVVTHWRTSEVVVNSNILFHL
jgi:hypothetical protein